MSEALSVLGADGAEILTDILNRYFHEMIEIIHGSGGQVMKFGGDAILCFFPGEETLPAALGAAARMQAKMPAFEKIKTPVKRFTLKMKIGVARGEVLLAGLGDPTLRCDYAFAGAPVDATSDAEHHANAGDVILAAPRGVPLIPGIDSEEVSPGFFRIFSIPESERPPETPVPGRESDARPWLIAEVADLISGGFERYVGALQDTVPVFLQFTGFSYSRETLDLRRLDEFFRVLMTLTAQYEGRLNRISMGDKGSTALLLFGAPRAVEQKENRAAQWAFELRQVVRRNFSGLTVRVGMSSGRVFAGIVGGAGRWDYTIMGDVVNFAARLMQGAEPDQICASEDFRRKAGEGFGFEALGERRFKGKSEPLPVFALTDRRRSSRLLSVAEPMEGRGRELLWLAAELSPGSSASTRLILLEGEPGVGKTLLADHALIAARSRGWRILLAKGELTEQHTEYSAWRELLAALVFQGETPTAEGVEAALNEANPLFVKDLFVAAEFFGVSHPASTTSIDPEVRRSILRNQLTHLLARKLGQAKTILFFDNLQWLDSASLALLDALVHFPEGRPVLVVGAARPGWSSEGFASRPGFLPLAVGPLDAAAVRAVAKRDLAGEIQGGLVDFVFERARGNPFLTRQLLVLLRKRDALVLRLGEWILKREEAMRFGGSSDEIIAASLGDLHGDERSHLQMAASIGPAFAEDVLKTAMGGAFRSTAMKSLVSRGHLRRLNERALAFSHGIVQETVYQSIPRKLRSRNHGRIGLALERSAEGGEERIVQLARHFTLSRYRGKAIDYALSVGEKLLEQSSYVEASFFLERADLLLRRSRDERRWRAGLGFSRALLRGGRIRESHDVTRALEGRARRSGRPDLALESAAIRYDALQRLGDYSYAESLDRLLATLTDADRRVVNRLRYTLGVAFYRRGNLERAEIQFQKIIEAPVGASVDAIVVETYPFLVAIAERRERFDEALATAEFGASLAAGVGDSFQEIRMRITQGSVLRTAGRPREALDILDSVTSLSERVGDTYLLGTISLGMGMALLQLGELDRAEERCRDARELLGPLGAVDRLADVMETLGVIEFSRGRFEQAHGYYLEGLRAFDISGNRTERSATYYNLAEVSMELGRFEEAQRWCKLGQESFQASERPVLAETFAALIAAIIEKEKATGGSASP